MGPQPPVAPGEVVASSTGLRPSSWGGRFGASLKRAFIAATALVVFTGNLAPVIANRAGGAHNAHVTAQVRLVDTGPTGPGGVNKPVLDSSTAGANQSSGRNTAAQTPAEPRGTQSPQLSGQTARSTFIGPAADTGHAAAPAGSLVIALGPLGELSVQDVHAATSQTAGLQDRLPAPAPSEPDTRLLMPALTVPVFDIRLVWATGQVVNPRLSDASELRIAERAQLAAVDGIRPIQLSQRDWRRMVNRAPNTDPRANPEKQYRAGAHDEASKAAYRDSEIGKAWAEDRALRAKYREVVGQIRAARDAGLEATQQFWENQAGELERAARALRRDADGVLRRANLPRPKRGTHAWQQWQSGRAEAKELAEGQDDLRRRAEAARAKAAQIAAQRAELASQPAGLRAPSRQDGRALLFAKMRAHQFLNDLLDAVDGTGTRILPVPVLEQLINSINATPPTRRGTTGLLSRMHDLIRAGQIADDQLAVLLSQQPVDAGAAVPARPGTGRGWLRTALVTAASGALAGGAFGLLGWVSAAALAAGAAVAAVVAVAVGTYRYVRESRGPPPLSATLVGTFIVLTTGLVQIGVGPAVVATAMGGAIIGSAVVRFLPDVVRGVRQRGALVAGLLADAGLAGRGGFPARVAARVRVKRELRANVAAAHGRVTAARQQVVELRALVTDFEAELGRAVRESIRWLLNPPDGTVRGPRYRAAVATVLGVPRALVDSIADDPGIWPDTPVAVGGEADRFQGFRTDVGVAHAAIQRLRQALENGERQLAVAIAAEQAAIAAFPGDREAAVQGALRQLAAIGGAPVSARAARRVGQVAAAGGGSDGGGSAGAVGVPAEGPQGSAPAVAGTARPATAPAVRSTTEANPIRGPPSLKGLRRFGAGRALRKALVAQEELRVRLAEADGRLREALAENRELRARFEEQAGGLRAIVGGSAAAVPAELAAQLTQSNEQLLKALDARRQAEADLAAKLARAVRAASAAGMQHKLLRGVTGLGGDTISTLTGPWRGDPERFPAVDAVNSRLMRWFNRGAEFGLPNGGTVTAGWLREQLGDTGRFVVMVGDDGSFTLVGRNRTAHYDLSDGHFHPAGYDHSRPPRVTGSDASGCARRATRVW